ncbi:type VI secretion protein [Salmonella enterica]|uniref:Type VI secretion protein n=1 Tax=Salmonella enterica TaxID=28901 RepID=A0A5U2F1P8_SALER|nr:type VI secretion protein [Salmonella enterica]EBH8037526.1 type VI secretion protein [Salmonella bongori]ECG0831024.1 type VI secretion protein [Salmonella enterica subsp. diarizonae]EAP3485616.1 type VI secretion protein [Salmonella enterica]EBD6774087.1 type VI secretion protein [Salmonella enterica]
MKRRLVAALVAGVISAATLPASASGIPTADAAQILGQAQQMVQDLKNYKEYMEQTVLDNKQLLEAYKQYNQMLEEYKQVLREAEGLKDKLSSVDYENFMNEIGRIADQYDPLFGSGKLVKDTGNEPWDDAVQRNQLLNGYGLTDEEYAEMLAQIPYSGDDRERARQIFEYRQRRVVEGISKDAFIGTLQKKLKKQGKGLIELQGERGRLGANDTTASIQFLAKQNELLLEQIQSLQLQQAEAMKYSGRFDDHFFNKRAEEEARKARQLQEAWKK